MMEVKLRRNGEVLAEDHVLNEVVVDSPASNMIDVGLYVNRFSIDQSVLDDLAQVGFVGSANVNPALGLHAAGGVEWQRDRVHFGVDVKYVFGQADTVSTVVDQVTSQVFRETSKLSLDGFWIAVGARFSF